MTTDALLDANAIITLCKRCAMHLLGRMRGFSLRITDSVDHEIKRDGQRSALGKQMTARSILPVRLEDLAHLELYARMRDDIGEGEASCLALAHQHGWRVVSDDQEAPMRRWTDRTIGERVMSLEDFLTMNGLALATMVGKPIAGGRRPRPSSPARGGARTAPARGSGT